MPEKRQNQNLGMKYEAEHWLNGHYFVGDYTTEEFGTEYMLTQLAQAQEIALGDMNKQVYQDLTENSELDDIGDEANDNPQFNADLRDIAEEWYGHVLMGHMSVPVTKPEPTTESV